VTPGEKYADEIVRGIESSGCMVLLISSKSNLSDHVLREVEQSVHLGRPVFPILIEKVQLRRALDYYIAPIHWIEATAGRLDKTAETLASAIQGDADWKHVAVAPSLIRRIRYRRDAFAAALAGSLLVVFAVLIAAFLAWSSWSQSGKAERDKSNAERDKNYLSVGWVTLSGDQVPSKRDRTLAPVSKRRFSWPILPCPRPMSLSA
jgi:hypothetical protein